MPIPELSVGCAPDNVTQHGDVVPGAFEFELGLINRLGDLFEIVTETQVLEPGLLMLGRGNKGVSDQP
jgi:hypothetical protein